MTKVHEFRQQVKDILNGRSHKKALIVGPCSIHNTEEALKYAEKLKKLADQVADHILIVMRVFLEKPRTLNSWRGFLYDPKLDGSLDLLQGMTQSHSLYKKLGQLELPLATEFIDPNLSSVFENYITWGFIGARTTRSPVHRQLASYLKCPIGFKNPLDGDLEAINGAIEVASCPHQGYFSDDNLNLKLVTTSGNPFCHGVLRGDQKGPNYQLAPELQGSWIIDCAHGNSRKTIFGQVEAFNSSINMCAENFHIKGLMLESYLDEGSQNLTRPLKPGLSITDPCLSFKTTEELVLKLYRVLSQSQGSDSVCTGSSLMAFSPSETSINCV